MATLKELRRMEYLQDRKNERKERDQATSKSKRRHRKETHQISKNKKKPLRGEYRTQKESTAEIQFLRKIFQHFKVNLRVILLTKKAIDVVGIFQKDVTNEKRSTHTHVTVTCKYPNDEEYKNQRKEMKVLVQGCFRSTKTKSVYLLIKCEIYIYKKVKGINKKYYEEKWVIIEKNPALEKQNHHHCPCFSFQLRQLYDDKEIDAYLQKCEKEWKRQTENVDYSSTTKGATPVCVINQLIHEYNEATAKRQAEQEQKEREEQEEQREEHEETTSSEEGDEDTQSEETSEDDEKGQMWIDENHHDDDEEDEDEERKEKRTTVVQAIQIKLPTNFFLFL